MTYEILDHTADVCVRVYGDSLEDFLRNAALAMMDITVNRQSVARLTQAEFTVKGETREELLVRMLAEILYLHETEKMVFGDIAIDLAGGDEYILSAKLLGEKTDISRHELELDIKAVTYHGLNVEEVNDNFRADIVFDI